MASITNMAQLTTLLNKKLKRVVDIITADIEETLKEYIIKYTYEYDETENEWYEPTYDFYNSFYKTAAKQVANEIVGWVVHDPMSMSSPRAGASKDSQAPYEHGNFEEGIDRRRILAQLLNVAGENSGFDFRGKQRQPFFDLTIQWIEDNWFYLVNNAFRRVGINNWNVI